MEIFLLNKFFQKKIFIFFLLLLLSFNDNKSVTGNKKTIKIQINTFKYKEK